MHGFVPRDGPEDRAASAKPLLSAKRSFRSSARKSIFDGKPGKVRNLSFTTASSWRLPVDRQITIALDSTFETRSSVCFRLRAAPSAPI